MTATIIAKLRGIALTCELFAPDKERPGDWIVFRRGCLDQAKRDLIPRGLPLTDGHGGPRLGTVRRLTTVSVKGTDHVAEILEAEVEDSPRARDILRRLAIYFPAGRTMGLSISGPRRYQGGTPATARDPRLKSVRFVSAVALQHVALAPTFASGNVPGTVVLGVGYPPPDGWEAAPPEPKAMPDPSPWETRLIGGWPGMPACWRAHG